MKALLDWLPTHPVAFTAVIVAFAAVVLAVVVIYVVAFFQGRELTFWPPRIGAKPARAAPKGTDDSPKTPSATRENPPAGSSPIVDRGTTLVLSSGERVEVESDYYGGATATLYKGRTDSGESVLVKVYWRGLAPGSPQWDAFAREQHVAETLSHRNIVRSVGRGLVSGYPFLVMEYLPGGTLRDWLQAHDRVRGEDVLSIAGQVADALDFAHGQGVIHRDVKPGNVLFESDPRGRVALGDFGIAKILGAVERDITAADNEFVGSPGYMAPEAVRGEQITTASDVYSFGVVVYEMICGQVPFDERGEVMALLLAKTSGDAADVRSFRKDVPPRVAERLAETLSRDPSKRPTSARAVLSGIEETIRSL